MLIFFLLLIIRIYTSKKVEIPNVIDEEYYVTNIEKKENISTITIKKKNMKFIFLTNEDFMLGEIIRIKGEIKLFEGASIPNGYNEKKVNHSKGIYGRVIEYRISRTNIVKVEYIATNFFLKLANKKGVSDYFYSFYFGKEIVDKDITNELSISNLFIISTMHIYFLLYILNKIMRIVNLDLKKQGIIRNIFIFSIYILTGYKQTILRILIYLLLRYIMSLRELKITNYSILLLSYFLLIMINPYLISSSTLLSNFITINFLTLFSNIYEKDSFILKTIKINFLITIINIPSYTELNFSKILFAPFYNVMIIYILFPISTLTLISNKFLIFENHLSKLLIIYFEKMKYLNVATNVRVFNIFSSIIFYLAFIMLLLANKKKKLLAILLLVILFIAPSIKRKLSGPKIYFLDVSQGDSIVYIDNDLVIVIDAYHSVSRFLKSLGISRIDYLIITHSDSDHSKEASSLLKDFKVKNIILSKYDFNYEDLNGNIIRAESGYNISNGGLGISFYGPIKKYEKANDNSLVFKLSFLETNILFTGDIESLAEFDIKEKYSKEIRSDILKVAHHGSLTSSTIEFLTCVSPKYAVISVGRENKYGFPNNEVIRRLENLNVKIYRTDLNNTIIYSDDKFQLLG